MVKKIFFLGAFMPSMFLLQAQTNKLVSPEPYAATISAQEMKTKMGFITSDEFAGRETGEPGQKLCAEYLADHFKKLGLPPVVNGSYMQTFPLREEKNAGYSFAINGKPYLFLQDYFAFQGIPDKTYSSDKLVFVGFGINDPEVGINEYKGLDVKGKIVAFFEDEPMDKQGNSVITQSTKISDWSSDLKLKTDAAIEAGAIGIISIQKHADNDIKMYRHYIEKPKTYRGGKTLSPAFPKFYVSEQVANDFFRLENKKYTTQSLKEEYRTGKRTKGFEIDVPVSITVKTENREITGENVLGYIEGTDLKDELVIITAHYDHLGKTDQGIFYGADDDGSGTVSLMEIAEAFVSAKKAGFGPRRSILIMPVSGEEKGLLGSEYYSENPVFPLEKTVTDLNIDMIGRVDKKHEGNFNYVYVIGADKLSMDLHNINEEQNKKYSNLELDYTFNDPKDPNMFYYRSDHYNFAKKGIPVIFYFTGVHADYHKMTDTPDKLHYEKMAKIAKHIFYTAWEVANRDERLKVDVKE
jgi:Zn-dependent M28 family amino/carboxypeptidase